MSSQSIREEVIENVIKSLDLLVQATSVESVLKHSKYISNALNLHDFWGIEKFFKLNSILDIKVVSKWDRVASILKGLENKTTLNVYKHRDKLANKTVLVIGGGIAGLRVAIELLLVGVKVICVEKRSEFTRNNVIHLWQNVIEDLNTFQAKRFYSQFCLGSINHVSIRQLQLILLKIAIIYGLRFIRNVSFDELCPRLTEPLEIECNGSSSCTCCCHRHGFGNGAYAHFSSEFDGLSAKELCSISFDSIINCEGSRDAFERYFPRIQRKSRLAIGLTANFINGRTEAETQCPEISGVMKIYLRDWFKGLEQATGVSLENVVYYRDETHYFVMTVEKQSLLRKGVLKEDKPTSDLLLNKNNINLNNLMKYSRDVAHYLTNIPYLDFAIRESGRPDIELFNFSSMYLAMNASCAKKTYRKCCQTNIKNDQTSSTYCLLMLAGDSLCEPFWPTGSGAGRGFLSAMDAAWMVQMWFTEASPTNIDSMLYVIAKREHVYRLLAQTSHENVIPKGFTLDPATRYRNLNLNLDGEFLFGLKRQFRQLIIDDRQMNVEKFRETKRHRPATVGVDPEALRKATILSQELQIGKYNFDDPLITSYPSSKNSSIFQKDVRRNNSFRNINNSNDFKIDESIQEFKPKNLSDIQFDVFEQKFVDHCPRNQNIPVSQNKKNYEAKNRVFEFEDYEPYHSRKDKLEIDDYIVLKMPQEVSPINEPIEFSPKECFSKNPDIYKEIFDANIIPSEENNSSMKNFSTSKSKSFGTSQEFYSEFNNEDSFQSKKNYLLYGNDRPKSAPKKCSEYIKEKSRDLKQMLDDLNKRMEPKLQKVGKFEEDDWNVKKWTVKDPFKKRLPDRQRLVFDNSAELLQSRIEQITKNKNYRNEIHLQKDNRPSTYELVNVRRDEICQKFNMPAVKSHNPLLSVSMVREQNSSIAQDASSSNVPRSDSGYKARNSPNSANFGTNSCEALPRNCHRCGEPVSVLDGLNIGGNQYHKYDCRFSPLSIEYYPVNSENGFT